MSFAMGWVDWTLLAILAVSVLVGAWRGLVFEMLSVLGWVAAYFAAQWFAPVAAGHLPIGTPGGALNHAAAFAAVFLGALVAWALAARLLRLLVQASPLSPVDRVLGAAFGLARGLIVLLALATVVGMTALAGSKDWQSSQGAHWLGGLLQGLKPVLPPQVSKHLRA